MIRTWLVWRYYNRWIQKIAVSDEIADLHEHIIKHALELREPSRNPASWSASMHNLLEIFDAKHQVSNSTDVWIRTMETHYRKHQQTRTAPPGGTVPRYVRKGRPPKFDPE